MNTEEHPTVIRYRQSEKVSSPDVIEKELLKKILHEAGADDAGFVEIDRKELQMQKDDFLQAFSGTKSLISFVYRVNRFQFYSTDRSLADDEVIASESEMERISRSVVKKLREKGIGAVVPAEGFPQDMSKWPGKMWTLSHKPVAVEAGLGHMGHHRMLIHPVFGNYVGIGTILIDAALDDYDTPLDYNPCIECKLCVNVCPTGAICKDGTFQFFHCLVHAYRYRLGGFINWIEDLITSNTMADYREKKSDKESLQIWQSLTHGGGYHCGYCMSVCPAGDEVIGTYLDDKKGYIQSIVKGLQKKKENVYVLADKDTEASIAKRFPDKIVKIVGKS